jgi:hypothetical protein
MTPRTRSSRVPEVQKLAGFGCYMTITIVLDAPRLDRKMREAAGTDVVAPVDQSDVERNLRKGARRR